MKPLHKKEWFDDDSFWRELYPFMFSQQRFADAEQQSGKVLALTRPQGRSVLDLCCGPGRFSVAFAKKGFAVTGVDRTKYLLDKARSKARAANAEIELLLSDMRDFLRLDSFDLVLSTFTSFGYFDDRQEDILVLNNMLASLKPNGACLIEVMGKEVLARVFKSPITTILPDGAIWVDRHEVFDDWTRVQNEWLVIQNGKTKKFTFHHTVYSGLELRERMERAGFVEVKLYGNLDGAEYGSNAERLIAVGRKPRSGHDSNRGEVQTKPSATAKTKRK